jgi:hypothetical protein
MWGNSWGQMIWGQATPVPALGFWGLMVLLAALGVLGVRRLRGGRSRLVGGAALGLALLVPISARALPFTFTNGTVADATQVNANFAAVAASQGVAPAATANMVDLVQNGACPVGSTGIVLNAVVGADAVNHVLTIPTGQTLILTSLSVTYQVGSASANHGVTLRFTRFNSFGSTPIESAIITLDAQGAGSTVINLGSGSSFGPGTGLCVVAQDLVNGALLNSTYASAHGFLTTQ